MRDFKLKFSGTGGLRGRSEWRTTPVASVLAPARAAEPGARGESRRVPWCGGVRSPGGGNGASAPAGNRRLTRRPAGLGYSY